MFETELKHQCTFHLSKMMGCGISYHFSCTLDHDDCKSRGIDRITGHGAFFSMIEIIEVFHVSCRSLKSNIFMFEVMHAGFTDFSKGTNLV